MFLDAVLSKSNDPKTIIIICVSMAVVLVTAVICTIVLKKKK